MLILYICNYTRAFHYIIFSFRKFHNYGQRDMMSVTDSLIYVGTYTERKQSENTMSSIFAKMNYLNLVIMKH